MEEEKSRNLADDIGDCVRNEKNNDTEKVSAERSVMDKTLQELIEENVVAAEILVSHAQLGKSLKELIAENMAKELVVEDVVDEYVDVDAVKARIEKNYEQGKKELIADITDEQQGNPLEDSMRAEMEGNAVSQTAGMGEDSGEISSERQAITSEKVSTLDEKEQVHAVLRSLGLLQEGVVNTAKTIVEVVLESEEEPKAEEEDDMTYETIWDVITNIPNKNPIVYNLLFMIKWIVLSAIIGIIVGCAGTAFSYALTYVTELRGEYPQLIYGLPFGGLAIAFLYHLGKNDNDKGTNLVLMSINQNDHLPIVMAPLIFVATAITHLFGGSSGREGAALQIGGCIGQNLGERFHFNESDVKIMTMCGMSSAFAALFGTPIAAAFLSMEIASVGVLYYGSLVPCVFSALIAQNVAGLLGVEADAFAIDIIPDFTLRTAVLCGALAVLSALVSILFCTTMHKSAHLYRRLIKNQYLRVFVGGLLVVCATKLCGSMMYNGAGMPIIEEAIEGNVPTFAFLLKILFTGMTLGAGFKGGEIVPSLFVGATFGCTFASIVGMSPAICAAVGMASLFCGITNCPISALMLCLELFGAEGMAYYLLAIALSYTFSGYFSVYGAQKIVLSKHRNKYINRNTK